MESVEDCISLANRFARGALAQETVQRIESVEDCISLANRDFARGGLAQGTVQRMESVEDCISLANRFCKRRSCTRNTSAVGVRRGWCQPCKQRFCKRRSCTFTHKMGCNEATTFCSWGLLGVQPALKKGVQLLMPIILPTTLVEWVCWKGRGGRWHTGSDGTETLDSFFLGSVVYCNSPAHGAGHL